MKYKRPFFYAFSAALYIAIIVLIGDKTSKLLPKETILIPMGMLSLFVLSAAIMGFLFLSEPIQLYLDQKKKEAMIFFLKTVGIFACFVLIFLFLNLIV